MSSQIKPTGIPTKVRNNLRNLGAVVEKLVGENLYSITGIVYGDEAWKVYEEWGKSIDGDPRVGAVYGPSEDIVDTALCPQDAIGIPLLRECNSIIYYYSSLRPNDFGGGDQFPEIGAPLRAPRPFVKVHHATMALSKLMERLQQPPANYPVLASLRSGSYICTVVQGWSNAAVDIDLFKP